MNLDETLNEAFETLSDRLRAELQSAATEIVAAVQAERERMSYEAVVRQAQDAPAPPAPAPIASSDTAASERMLEGVRAIGAAHSLSEVLDTLAGTAAREASRAAVLLVRGSRLRAWRFVGFPAAFDEPGAIVLELSEAGVIADAVHDAAPAGGTNAPLFAALPEQARCLAVPIALGGEVVAIVYADEGFGAVNDATWPHRVEVLAQFAGRCLEAITSFRTARLIQRQSVSAAQASNDPAERDPAGADAAARRYARLLVSEIKLYHEPDVLAGRRARDLATRLASEIARARQLYEQRVPPHPGEHADYFHAELVRTLADGDAALLELV